MSLIVFVVNKITSRKMPTIINPKKAVESAAPALKTSQYHTHSSALSRHYFTGGLQPWLGFLDAVRSYHEGHAWRQQILGYTLGVRDPYTHGNVEVGDEHGVKGRFQKYFGDVLNTIFASQFDPSAKLRPLFCRLQLCPVYILRCT